MKRVVQYKGGEGVLKKLISGRLGSRSLYQEGSERVVSSSCLAPKCMARTHTLDAMVALEGMVGMHLGYVYLPETDRYNISPFDLHKENFSLSLQENHYLISLSYLNLTFKRSDTQEQTFFLKPKNLQAIKEELRKKEEEKNR